MIKGTNSVIAADEKQSSENTEELIRISGEIKENLPGWKVLVGP
jgi:hypothetical protein